MGAKPQQLQRPGLSCRRPSAIPGLCSAAGATSIAISTAVFDDLLQGQPNPADPWEVQRARELVASFGAQGANPCQVVIDLHSTTAAMGNCLVLYGRRPADLALAAACQERLGLPIYQHEHDPEQTGFMAEAWPCGLVLEVGPVPQGVISPLICQQTQLGLETLLDLVAEASQAPLKLRSPLRMHRHSGSLDLPRDSSGQPTACLHPAAPQERLAPLEPGASPVSTDQWRRDPLRR